LSNINPTSLEVLKTCRIEPLLASAKAGDHYQFERLGYFCVDPVDSRTERPVFNRTATLRDTWANIQKAGKKG
jgi:glutaminyl-tRNA synthetase